MSTTRPTSRATTVFSARVPGTWVGSVPITAHTTNVAPPTLHRATASHVRRLMIRWRCRACNSVVMTSAITPMGCTTVTVASESAATFSTVPRPSSASPLSQRRLRTRGHSPRGVNGPSVCPVTATDCVCVPSARHTAELSARATAIHCITDSSRPPSRSHRRARGRGGPGSSPHVRTGARGIPYRRMRRTGAGGVAYPSTPRDTVEAGSRR